MCGWRIKGCIMERSNDVDPGEFPFPLSEGSEEPRCLTWVRNHSNYMAERGFLDWMRIGAVVVRGVLVNFLTVLPALMTAALLLGVIYNPMLDDWDRQDRVAKEKAAEAAGADAARAGGGEATEVPGRFFLTRDVEPEGAPPANDRWQRIGSWVWWVQDKAGTSPPFLLTPIIVLLGLGYICLFPVVTRLFKVSSHGKARATGSSSSVGLRDLYERSFGGFLIAALGMALIELLPLLIHHFHQAETSDLRGALAMFAGAGSALAVSGAGKLISVLGDAWKKLAMLVVGLLGLILPLIVMLYIGEYVVYAPDPQEPVNLVALSILPGLIVLGILAALALGMSRKAFDRIGWVLRLLGLVVASFGALFALNHYGILDGRWFVVLAAAYQIWLFCWLAVDVNLTSLHGLYRDRLASAYLVGEDSGGDVDIEDDVDLNDICRYETFSTAPYYILNVTHNLQGSKDIAIRDRNSDFFIFSKHFVGSGRTGYCRSESLETVYPQVDLATAMAISAAAAAPNMGTGTSGAMVALMTLLNVRMGFWIPNPGLLEGKLAEKLLALEPGERKEKLVGCARYAAGAARDEPPTEENLKQIEERLKQMATAAERKPEERIRPQGREGLGYEFSEVFREELADIRERWANAYPGMTQARRGHCKKQEPTPRHNLIGLGMSGGGIRSATINTGILQTFHRKGVFDHIDYMSTVSGGGYLGSSISTLMRTRTPTYSELAGEARVEEVEDEVAGTITQITVTGKEKPYKYRKEATLSEPLEKDKTVPVSEGQSLVTSHRLELAGLGDRFRWRVPPVALAREMFGMLDETHRWVNLSDGGHLENLATIELLRRRCRFIITGDCESDPKLFLGSLAALIRFARIDLGIEIQIDAGQIHLDKNRRSRQHFAIGRIQYPNESEPGWLLYLKSSFTGDEEELIHHYRNTHPAFPHETTADQFFDEGQFEAYRALGQHIGEKVLAHAPGGATGDWSFEEWFKKDKTVAAFFEAWYGELEKDLPILWEPELAPELEPPAGDGNA